MEFLPTLSPGTPVSGLLFWGVSFGRRHFCYANPSEFMGRVFAMHDDHVTNEADAQIDFWRSSQRNTTEAFKPDQAVLKIADEAIRIRVELTAIRRALQKIANK
jgi:hypothetical protein